MIDFHCHLDLYPDPGQVVRECAARGVYVLSVTTTPSAWSGTAALAVNAPRIRTGLGLHPQLAHQRKSEMDLFERLLPQVRYVGEIGLDGAPEYRPHWADQMAVFTRALDACRAAGGRILSLHSRRAPTEVVNALKERPGVGTPILHWFSGNISELQQAIDLGCWFSVGPAMLATDKGHKLASRMPKNRILTESDGPFAQINGRPAMPWDVDVAVAALSAVWACSLAETEQQLLANLRKIGALVQD